MKKAIDYLFLLLFAGGLLLQLYFWQGMILHGDLVAAQYAWPYVMYILPLAIAPISVLFVLYKSVVVIGRRYENSWSNGSRPTTWALYLFVATLVLNLGFTVYVGLRLGDLTRLTG